MVVRIVIAGETQCSKFAEVCLVADYLAQNVPNFEFVRIEKVVAEFKNWLANINIKNKWHHNGSPIVWKEMLIEGGKPFYIGGASEFLDYCFSYYKIDTYLWTEKFEFLLDNFDQMKNKYKIETKSSIYIPPINENTEEIEEAVEKDSFCVCLFGAGHPLTMHLVSRLLEMSRSGKPLLKIFLYDTSCDPVFLRDIAFECSFMRTSHPGKCVRYVEKPGMALTQTDLLIVLDHEIFDEDMAIGEWLYNNKKKMEHLALMLNSSAIKTLRVVFPNVGPACYNATVLGNNVNVISKNNIVVATSNLGVEIAATVAMIAEVPIQNMFCPPVWGFVGINHLVDVNTTIHKYCTFDPYKRYTKVMNSTLRVGKLTPEMRTMEYLMYFDETLWEKIVANRNKIEEPLFLNKVSAVIDLVKIWLFDPKPEYIVSLGVHCDGSFGLRFNGIFSQPARLVDGVWKPASDFFLPRDRHMKLSYLEYIARNMMKLGKGQLKKIEPYYPCSCKATWYKKKDLLL